jgi:MBG domain-containing protein
VTAGGGSTVYGAADPAIGATSSGAALSNDAVTYVDGTFAIAPAALTVVADPQTKVAGTADPALTFTASGFQNGDTAAVLSGGLTRVAGEAAGSYPILQGTLAAGANYAIAFVASTLTITAPPPPPALFAIAPIAPQVNNEGDEVELEVHVIGATHTGRDDDRGRDEDDDHGRVRGAFAAAGLPDGLQITGRGVIRGHVRRNTAQPTPYQVTVMFTQDGVTVSQTFDWTINAGSSRRGDR